MIYMGIDGSTTSSGIGILDDKQLLHYLCIKPKSKDWEERIGILFIQLDQLLKTWKPEYVIAEDVPLKDGKPTIKKLSAVRGAMISACAYNNIPFRTLPLSGEDGWRQKAGFFDGTKEGMTREAMKAKAIKEVKCLFDIDVNDDIAEGILIAYRDKYPVKKERKGFNKNKTT